MSQTPGSGQLVLILIIVCILISQTSLSNTSLFQKSRSKTIIYNAKNRPKIIYGHVHMAKTAGTSLNGELAARYERVCGHKGYSYDAFQVNKRRNSSQGNKVVDGLSKLNKGYSRSRVSPSVMSEIGYEDCDYISHETGWSFWPHTFQKWFFPMELHVPCREPISHLMSMCNQRNMTFDCTKDIVGQSKRCLVEMGRFSSRLVNTYSNIPYKMLCCPRDSKIP